uniref:Troponin I, cardiac muscle n=3 Tax=Equus TaxID=9789 RepID=A0A9L0RPV1_HORSE
MGRPPDPHSTLVPVRTTAAPRLTPDLIAGLPCESPDTREGHGAGPVGGGSRWPQRHLGLPLCPLPGPHWAPIAVAVVAGILVVSCLLCAICCCCRHGHRHGKKPRDKEAVGLGGLPGTTTTHLVQPDVDNEGDPKPWGRLLLSLQYDFGSQEIRVGLKQAADLRPGGPGGTADPYARVSLSTQAGRWHETRVHRGTLCPVFDETCCFHPEQTGDLCFSLRYTPGSGRLTVVVLEARGLSPTLADPYVKVQLMLNQRKWKKRKTQARKGPAAPYFNEAFAFLVPISQVQALSPGLRMGDEEKRNRAITARRQHLKSVMLQIAATELEKEESRRETEKQNYLSEHCPPLHIPGPMAEVQELCKQLHAKIDAAEEEKYDMEMKVQKSTKELEDMNQKLFDLRGKFKRPPLRRVRMSADAMLKALLGSKHKVCMDLRANLKQVKKEDTEKERDLRDVGDWRKNIEEKSGMEGRKKMFETES